jgi:hypothetical protein
MHPASNPSVWNLELKIYLKNLLIFVIWVLFNSLGNSDKLLALQTPTPMATWETQPHYQLRISSCLLYNASSSSSNPLKNIYIYIFPTSRTPINHNFQSAGRKTPELEYYYRSITKQQYTEFWDNYICTYIFINSVHHNVPSSLFLVASERPHPQFCYQKNNASYWSFAMYRSRQSLGTNKIFQTSS